MKRALLLFFAALFLPLLIMNNLVFAELSPDFESILEDSEEDFSRRIYSYDFDVDTKGTIHVIYLLPVPGEERAEAVYAYGSNGEWTKTTIESDAKLGSISTGVIVDPSDNSVHICYIKHQNDPDTHLVYQVITDNVPGDQTIVEYGGWHTRMQLNGQGKAIFVRQGSNSLRLFSPLSQTTWTQSEMDLPQEIQYRIADFVYNADTGTYHVTYGNDTTFHDFIYAQSNDGDSWTISLIDDSGKLYELEFWTDLFLDNSGNPYASMYKYADNNTGTSALLGKLDGDSWDVMTVAGGTSDARAGMGARFAVDQWGAFHAFWDNSPDVPIDADGERGNIMYRYSPDGEDWEVKQAVAPYSAEGTCMIKVDGRNLYLLVLGDYIDAKLYFLKFTLPEPDDNLFEVLPDKMFYDPGETIALYARLQGSGTGDIYLVVSDPHDNMYYLGSDFQWHRTSDLNAIIPAISATELFSFNSYFMNIVAGSETPFNDSGDFLIFSVVNSTDAMLDGFSFLSPLYTNKLHIW